MCLILRSVSLFILSVSSFALISMVELRAEPATGSLSGSIRKSNKQETLEFDVTIRGGLTEYRVVGSTSTSQGWFWSELDYSGIRVYKQTLTEDGRVFVKEFKNVGKMNVWMRDRTIKDMTLVGLPIEGRFVNGKFVDYMINLSPLTVDGVESKGILDYTWLTGRYHAKRDAHFGACQITSSNPSGRCIMDYDTWRVKQNTMSVHMNFGGLRVTGRINYDDVTAGPESDEVISTTGKMNLTIARVDDTDFLLAPVVGQGAELEVDPDDADLFNDEDVRILLIFFQLISFDMWAE